MSFNLDLNLLCYPVSINLLISILFLLFFIIKKDTRSGYVNYLLGLISTFSLSQMMTSSALLIQVATISLFLNFLLIILFQDNGFVKKNIIPLICLFVISIISTFTFNNGINIIALGCVFSSLIFGIIWIIKLRSNKNKSDNIEIYSWEIFLLFASVGLFLGINNLVLLLIIMFVIFILSFLLFYTQGSDHNISIVKYIIFSTFIWFLLVHYLPSFNIERLFNI